ncbi:MAG: autotransporter assembly complex family protein, partial [Gammaproteobacteria bacterium]|nr:autotransporter assembly complex family protein [Gammaproteobacteria bacterium]
TGPASTDPTFQNLQSNTVLRPGEPLHHGRYENFKRSLMDLARNRGYVEAALVENRVDVYPDQNVADITLHVESGPRYRIGDVEIVQDLFEPSFIDAYHNIESGEPYDNRLLTSAYIELNESGFFSSVDVRAMPADAGAQTIPIRIELTGAPRQRISYGVGFSTDTGPRFRAGRLVRRLNERGHQLSIDGQLSPVVSEITSTYRLPYGDPRFDWLNFNLGAKREETDTSLARSIVFGVRRIRDRPSGWSRTLFTDFSVEDFEVGLQKGRPHLLMPGIDWVRLRGDDALRPDNGSRLSFEIRGASESLVSDTTFLQVYTDLKWIDSVFDRGRVLVRGHVGYTDTDEFHRLPPSIRFFAGGDNSIRGFEFESLGPVDADGHVIGGPRLVVASVEYEHEIKPRWSLAMFVDSGNAFDDRFDARTGAGFGARWRSPLGPIRIDIGWPVNDIEHGARLHVSLGPDL